MMIWRQAVNPYHGVSSGAPMLQLSPWVLLLVEKKETNEPARWFVARYSRCSFLA
jgi:hypothetical protein